MKMPVKAHRHVLKYKDILIPPFHYTQINASTQRIFFSHHISGFGHKKGIAFYIPPFKLIDHQTHNKETISSKGVIANLLMPVPTSRLIQTNLTAQREE